jgi:hypothetical protein
VHHYRYRWVYPQRYKWGHPRRHKWVKPIRRKAIVRSGPRHFFPGGTTPPKLGRHESDEPMSPPPTPAEDFSRSWSARSSPAPATIAQPPALVGPIIVDQRGRPRPAPPRPGP